MSSTRARALAIAAVWAAGEDAPALLARVAGADAEAARVEAARLIAAGPEALAAETARLRAPRPPGVELVHPTWREEVIETRTEPARVWAERRAFAALVPMPAREVEQVVLVADLPYARADWIVGRLERVGLRQVAHATATAPKAELAALAARLGNRGRAFIEAVTRIAELGDAAASLLGPRRAAQARCKGVRLGAVGEGDAMGLLVVGARAIAPHLAAGGDVAWQVAQRLPRAAGERVLAELLGWAEAVVEEAPAWSEVTGV